MKVYKIELYVPDFDGLGPDGIKSEIENTRYANHCISPTVMNITEKDIGEWSDDHPLNKLDTIKATYDELFPT